MFVLRVEVEPLDNWRKRLSGCPVIRRYRVSTFNLTKYDVVSI